MMIRILIVLLTVHLASSFGPSRFNARSKLRLQQQVAMSSLSQFDPKEDMAGVVAPTGFFDPLGLSNGQTTKTMQKWRESELKHGRIAMLAAVGIPLQESFHPLFSGQVQGPAIFHFQEIENLIPPFWYFTLFAISLFEGVSITRGWQSLSERKTDPQNPTGSALLKDKYVPGDLGFDPLNLNPTKLDEEEFGDYSPAFKTQRTRELQNGRVAMLAVAGYVAQELVDTRTILEHLQEFGLGQGTPFV